MKATAKVGASPERLRTVHREDTSTALPALSSMSAGEHELFVGGPVSPGGTHLAQRLEPIDRQITVLSGMIERLENRLTEDENNFGRALALLEDRIKDLEAVGESVSERLYRLESPASTETAGGLRDVAVLYRCTACNPTEGLPPCACLLSLNLGKPDGCIYRKGCPAEWVPVRVDFGGLILQAVQE